MFKRILVPLDGSATAERALPIALRLSRVINGTIVLLRVVNTNWPSQTTLTQQLPAAARFEAEKYLQALVKSDRFSHVSIETLVSFGIEAPTILSTITTHHIDLVVICGHEYSNINRWVVGSVVDKVARQAEVPVMLLHHDEVFRADPQLDPPRTLRILVPLDGSIHAEAALNPAAELIAALTSPLSGTIHIMRVIEYGTSYEEKEHLQQANDYLQRTIARIRQGELAPAVTQYKIAMTWSVAVDTDISHSILNTAAKADDTGEYNIIAMATHGLAGLSHWLRSTTENIHHHARQPFLIVQPHPTSGEHEKELTAHIYETNPL